MPHDEPIIDDTAEPLPEDGTADERPDVIEHYRAEELTTFYRLKRLANRVVESALTSVLLGLLLYPVLVLGALTVDLPATLFDGWTSREVMRPSQWLSRGDLFMSFSVFMVILMTRRHGGQVASQALGLGWILLILSSVGLLLYVAPTLGPGELAYGRFTIGFVAGWYGGAWVAIRVYDLTRGSEWWRPPFLSLAAAFLTQSLVTIPITYAGSGLPWTWWLGGNVVIQVFLTVVYVSAYRLLRQRFRPRSTSVTAFGGK